MHCGQRDVRHRRQQTRKRTLKTVKRFIQSVALALLALVTAQPVLAASDCLESLHRRGECLPTCCAMHDHHMSAPGHAAGAPRVDTLAAPGCGHAGCSVSTPALLQSFRPVFVEPTAAIFHTNAASQLSSLPASSAGFTVLDLAGPTPPRRILLQTFRI